MPEFIKKCRLRLQYGVNSLTVYQGDLLRVSDRLLQFQGVDPDRREALFIETETNKPVRMTETDFRGCFIGFICSGGMVFGACPVSYRRGSVTYELTHRDWSAYTLQQIADQLVTDKETVSKAMRLIYLETGQRVVYKQVKPHWKKLHVLPDV